MKNVIPRKPRDVAIFWFTEQSETCGDRRVARLPRDDIVFYPSVQSQSMVTPRALASIFSSASTT